MPQLKNEESMVLYFQRPVSLFLCIEHAPHSGAMCLRNLRHMLHRNCNCFLIPFKAPLIEVNLSLISTIYLKITTKYINRCNYKEEWG